MSLFTNNYHEKETVAVPFAQNITVNEHRAPTDESIKIFNELREKAKQDIIASVKIDENCIKATVVLFRDDLPITGQHAFTYHIRFVLNGKEHTIKKQISGFDFDNYKKQVTGTNSDAASIYMVLLKLFSEAVASEILEQSGAFDALCKAAEISFMDLDKKP